MDIKRDGDSENTPVIKTTKVVYPQVYSYTLPDLSDHKGSQKIGYTERKDVDLRIREQTHTAAVKLRSEKLWSAPSFYDNSPDGFTDKLFHKFLVKSGIENKKDLGIEWFYFNGYPEKSKQLFDEFRKKGFTALQSDEGKAPYTLRTEQELAVKEAKKYFETQENGEFLWNAKPRFGKTLATYDLAKTIKATKILIVTNRPAIANSWFDDFDKFIDGYYFISETSSLDKRPTISRQQYISSGSGKPQITFLSIQDLKGSKYFGGGKDKLKWIADLEWDLLVIDEAHEGIDTYRTDNAFNNITRQNTLHLSGTPFKALANNKFPNEAIFNWTYLDEQKIKKAEIEENEVGDHTDLPNLRLYTYRISQMISDEVNEGVEIDDQTRDYAFDLNEFFTTKNQKFVHEDDVKQFLKNLTTNSRYPFSSKKLRDELKHTFWYVGNRVESVKALEQLLKQDEVFGNDNYKIVVAAGDGRSFSEEEDDFNANEKSFDKVNKAIKENQRTITLSCGQLTTGVTIKEWSAVLMLTDIKSTPLYMQAAFRAQNPYKFFEDGNLKAKQSAYLFDFAPTRVLEMYDEFANGLNPNATNGEITEKERKNNIKELLNYFPVVSEDVDGRMIELDAEKVLTFPNALAATEIVKARFMTNLLFNENIKGVFRFPKEVEDILDKMPVEKNKRVETSKKELDLDDARKVEDSKQKKINENSDVILGEKIYRTNIDRVVDNALDSETPEETINTLPPEVMKLAEPVIAKLKETYHHSQAETEEFRQKIEEKVKLKVAEYEKTEEKDPEALKSALSKVIEHDLVISKVEEEETKTVENVQKSKEEQVREHLRSFTRTIPMFIMANSSKETITIDNFDEEINDEDFVDLTNITKEEFHKLRDGFEYDDDGKRKRFEGVFDRYKFNASITEFVEEKERRANYFKTEEDIFELIPNQKNNQIFTPIKVVKLMVDGLEKENPELFHRTDSTFIDLYMKSGMYITEITKRLFANTRNNYSSDIECIKHILENQVYGLSPTGILHGITQSYIFGFDNSHNISNRNFIQHDLLPEAKNGTAQEKLQEIFQKGDDMKFDAVVGNPPFHKDSGSKQKIHVWHYFVMAANEIGETVCLIHPSGWVKGGIRLDVARRKWQTDKNLKRIVLREDSVFNDVSTGPVTVTLFDNSGDKYDYPTLEVHTSDGKEFTDKFDFSRNVYYLSETDKLTNKIIKKFRPKDEMMSMTPSVSAQRILGIEGKHFKHVNADFSSAKTKKHSTRVLVNEKLLGETAKKEFYYIDCEDPRWEIRKKHVSSWKVAFPATGNRQSVSNYLLKPGDLATDKYLFVFFDSEIEAQNFKKYISTNFYEFAMKPLLVDQNALRKTHRNVPLQDFSVNSDIDWSRPIPEIDQQLYAKYKLSREEINFIESKVKPME